MREAKFRAWDIEREYMESDDSVVKFWMARAADPDDTDDTDGQIHLMQYTGLKDKNGQEVYEGDLVAPTGGYEDGECDHPSEVHWNEYNLQWEALCKTCADAVPLAEFDLHSVVGNVYESR